ncbi:hypothetical protein IF1G_00144 [Cordyceps javanica]|uniref:Uncharacterized protein n=1 Tax=Cordyceps javanica TaxID=43265 RepID=A0A545VER2_9HYPO|nr:hypothetical protein IF1G_00144 [Cordyceps javanica]
MAEDGSVGEGCLGLLRMRRPKSFSDPSVLRQHSEPYDCGLAPVIATLRADLRACKHGDLRAFSNGRRSWLNVLPRSRNRGLCAGDGVGVSYKVGS